MEWGWAFLCIYVLIHVGGHLQGLIKLVILHWIYTEKKQQKNYTNAAPF